VCTEPDYAFEKELNDADAYEKETAEFECEVNDEEATVQWFREDKVHHSPVSFLSLCLHLKLFRTSNSDIVSVILSYSVRHSTNAELSSVYRAK